MTEMDEFIIRGGTSVQDRPNVWEFLVPKVLRHKKLIAQVDAEQGIRATYLELFLMSEKVCSLLESTNLAQGSIILIKCSNSLLLAPLLLGAWQARLACALVHPSCKAAELENMQRITNSKLLIAEDDKVRAFVAGQELPNFSMRLQQIVESRGALEAPADARIEVIARGDDLEPRDTDLALVLSSSGSTGMPKGVALTHQNVITALQASREYTTYDEVSLCVLPLSHAFGLILMLMSIREGAVFVMLNKFNLVSFFEASERFMATTVYLVPQLLHVIASNLKQASCYMDSVVSIWTGASPVRYDLQQKVSLALQQKPTMLHSYGMTETTFTVFAGASRQDKPGSCGTINDGFECKVVEVSSNKNLPVGRVGELHVRSLSVMKGYLRNAEATAEALDEHGWLRTGDLGYFDEDGYFFVVDRIKEMIKCNSHQVSPNEIEQVISCMSCVEEVAVVGLPDDVSGEVPVALVVKRAGSKVTTRQITDIVSEKLSSYKHIRRVVFVNSLPKSPGGKLLRKQALAMIYPPREPRIESGMVESPYGKSWAAVASDEADSSPDIRSN